jgi:hypothetical protein
MASALRVPLMDMYRESITTTMSVVPVPQQSTWSTVRFRISRGYVVSVMVFDTNVRWNEQPRSRMH